MGTDSLRTSRKRSRSQSPRKEDSQKYVSQLFQQILCPVCSAHFVQRKRQLVCSRKHSFDLARAGYVNLLRGRPSGDVKEMLLARHQFLAQDHYQLLSDTVNEMVATFLQGQPQTAPSPRHPRPRHILDIGCGEGYYLSRLQHALKRQSERGRLAFFGTDISKAAIRMAAKQHSHVCFFVADVKQRLLMRNQSVHVLLNIFAPRNPTEFARIVAPRGLLVVVIPNAQHLSELRTALPLLRIHADKPQDIRDKFVAQFKLVQEKEVAYRLSLTTPELRQLVLMTPNYWHVSPQTLASLNTIPQMQVSVGFTLLVFQRKTDEEE